MGRPFLNSVVLCDLDLWLFCSKIGAFIYMYEGKHFYHL